MKTYLEKSKEELKRADHLIYVSLKYTRTVDVLQSILQRLVQCFTFSEIAILEYLKFKEKIEEIPGNVVARINLVREYFPNEEIDFLLDLFIVMRRILRQEPVKSNEFRRGVRMSTILNDCVVSVDIDSAEQYYKEVETFLRIATMIIDTDDEITPEVLDEIVKGVAIDLAFERN